MLRCISNPYSKDLNVHDAGVRIRDRDRLLAALLASRDVLRVICAPSFFGKTILAHRYAQRVFDEDDVCFIDASNPSFLLALDAFPAPDFSVAYLDEEISTYRTRLFIFDACPHLDTKRFNVLCSLIVKLVDCGHEVILTTRDSRWLELREICSVRIDARMMLLDEKELASWSYADEGSCEDDIELSYNDEQAFARERICGCNDDSGFIDRRMVEMLCKLDVSDEAAALSLIAVVLGSGSIHELHRFVSAFSQKHIVLLERRYPFSGVTRLDPMFTALRMTDEQRLFILRAQLASITRTLECEDESAFIEDVVCMLVARKQEDLATRLVCSSHDGHLREGFLVKNGDELLFSGKPLLLLHLARTLPRQFFAKQYRWQMIVKALVHLKEREIALDVARSFIELWEEEQDLTEEHSCDQLFMVLLSVVEGDEAPEDDRLIEVVKRCQEVMFPAGVDPRDRRAAWLKDLLDLIERSCTNIHDAYATLERILTSGHSLKEALDAVNVFCALLLHAWSDRMTGSKSSTKLDHRMLDDDEVMMLSCLERSIVHILRRQSALFDPNLPSYLLFSFAQRIYGERIYLAMDDSVLKHLEAAHRILEEQRCEWQIGRGAITFSRKQRSGHESQKSLQRKEVRINTLGRFEVNALDPHVVVKDKFRKQLRLLISLLAINEGREVARPWVQRIIWPNASDHNAKQSLYTTWSLLNKSIVNKEGKCPYFESFSHSLALNTQLVETDTQHLTDICIKLRERDLDVSEYEIAIREVESLYRGPLLPGDETAEVVARRKTYQDRLLEALLRSGERLRKQGETALALRYFRFAFDIEPSREDVCYQLMLALWKQGRHGDALNEYFVCRSALVDAYGIECSSKLRDLYEEILSDVS